MSSGAAASVWSSLARDAEGCTACELHLIGTQTVFGAGPVPAPLMLVGEQPGDQEDKAGTPFVGPAGRVLHRALDEAGLSGTPTYVTNAVKHFRWEPRGKRRIHRQPGAEHVRACHGWLLGELDVVDPRVVVLLGAVATRALAPERKVTADRGEAFPLSERTAVVTTHPSAVLRAPDRDDVFAGLVHDLRVAAELLR